MPHHTLIVAQQHALLRAGLVALLQKEPAIEILAEAGDGEKAFECVERLCPDVALVDLSMPGLSGVELARRVRGAGLRTAVVIFAAHHQPDFVRASLEAGAAGCLAGESLPHEFVEALKWAAAGKVYLSPRLGRGIVAAMGRPEVAPSEALTGRERDVLRLLASGLASKEIASRLEISVRTVDGYRAAILGKLDIRSIAGLVKYALKNHLASLDD